MTPAIILAGSHIWDAGPFGGLCPRSLLPVANAPLIEHLFAWLKGGNVRDIVICDNHGGAALQTALGDGSRYGVDLFYFEDRVPRGPAGCVRDVAGQFEADEFVVVDGSILPTVDLEDLLATHRSQKAALTVAVHEPPQIGSQGGSASSPTGIYVFDADAVDHVPPTSYQDIKESLIPRLVKQGDLVNAYYAPDPSPRVIGLDSYFSVQAWMLDRVCRCCVRLEDYECNNEICVHSSAYISPKAKVIGPAMIGPHTVIEDEAIVIGPCVLGAGVSIARQAVIGRSIVWDACVFEERVVVDRCLVPSGVTLRADAVRRGMVCDEPGRKSVVGTGNRARVTVPSGPAVADDCPTEEQERESSTRAVEAPAARLSGRLR